MNQITKYLYGRLSRPGHLRRPLEDAEKQAHQETVQGRLDELLDQWRNENVTDNEFLPLLGQAVRWQDEGAAPIQFCVPLNKDPNWIRFGLRAKPTEDGCVGLACAMDKIQWLETAQRDAIRAACRQEYCERPQPVTGDAWLLDTGHSKLWADDQLPEYKSPGQRDLLRAVDDLPPGEVLLGTLTTGEGKSLVIHRLVAKHPDKLVLVVVPTVALAQDQETEAHEVLPKEGLPKELAYLGGDKAQDEIRERIVSGTQRLVFCNPESLRGVMSVLQGCARNGRLAAVVVDEAHVVDTDGWQFRPPFLWIPSMCKSFIQMSEGSSVPPRVVLLSATFTQATYDSLRRSFESIGNEEMRVAGSLRLRGVINQVCEQIGSEGGDSALEVRKARIRRLLPLIPRPFYLYATEPKDVEEWKSILQDSGLTRVDCVHGKTKTEAKSEILRKLRSGALDAVAANSAFGLGLNVPNVRSVLHACVPDGLDRYYQEIGRAGRDDRQALSWWLWCKEDLPIARKQATRTVLNEAGPRRWQAMWSHKESAGDGSYWLPIGAQLLSNKAHEDWDICCLVLMAGARLIEFVWNALQRPEGMRDALCVRLLSERSMNTDDTWQAAVGPTRKRLQSADAGAYDHMVRVLRGRDKFWTTLAKTYALTPHGADASRQPRLDNGFPHRESELLTECVPSSEGDNEPETISVVRCEKGSMETFRRYAKLLITCRYPTAAGMGANGNSGNVSTQRWVLGWEDEGCLAAALRELTPEERRFLQLSMWTERGFSDFPRWIWIWSENEFSMQRVRDAVCPGASCVVFLQASARSVHPTATIEHEVGAREVDIDQLIQQPDLGAPF